MPGTQMTPEELQAQIDEANQQIGIIQGLPGYVSPAQKAEMIAKIQASIAQGKQQVSVSSNTNPDFVYRGDPNAAGADLSRYRGYADLSRSRPGIYADYANANEQRANGLAARGAQQDALGLYRDAAYGRGPSAAQAQLQMGVDRGIQSAMSIGNSARGGSLALAQGRLAAQNAAQGAVAQSSAQATSLRNQEMQQGMAGYAGLGSQIRGQDMQGQGADAQMAQSQASLGLQSRGLNDQTGLAYEGLGQGVVSQAGALGLAREAALQRNADALTAQANALAAQNAQNSANTRATVGTAISLVPVAGQAVNGLANYGASQTGSTTTPDGFTHLNSAPHTTTSTTAPTAEPTRRVSQWGGGTTGWSPRKYF